MPAQRSRPVILTTNHEYKYRDRADEYRDRVVFLVRVLIIWFCVQAADTDASPPTSAEASPNPQVCPAWEGLGKGFLDLALGLVAPLDASCPRVARTPSPSLTDQERMQNAWKMFNRELDERLGSISR